MVRSRYTYTVDEENKIISITDIGHHECMSVTNDMENVLGDVAMKMKRSISPYVVIYRDSDNLWDKVEFKINNRGEYIVLDWTAMQEPSHLRALERIMMSKQTSNQFLKR